MTLSIKATVVPKGEKEFEVVIGTHVIGTSKQRFDADLHSNVINNALQKAYEQGLSDDFYEGYNFK